MPKLLSLVFLACLSLSSVFAQQKGYTTADILIEYNALKRGASNTLAVTIKHKSGWHSYWLNPGESGKATNLTWQVPEKVTVSDALWQTPDIFTLGPLVNYGYKKTVVLQDIQVPADYQNTSMPISLALDMLVCEKTCIPETVTVKKTFAVRDTVRKSSHHSLIQKARSQLPSKSMHAEQDVENENLIISFPLSQEQLAAINHDRLYFFVEQTNVIKASVSQQATFTDSGLMISMPLLDETLDRGVSGILRLSDELSYAVEAIYNDHSLSVLAVLLVSLAAFIGGLILNIMPCVFPILSLKVFGILEKSESERHQLKKQALAYTAGILVSFFLILATLILLKSVGYAVGWGFQLQQPLVVYALMGCLFALGLHFNNLLDAPQFLYKIPGLFSRYSSKTNGSSLMSDFLTGVLAVFVATPCTAPFMAGAIGIALSQNVLVMSIIFSFLALGFAFPYLLIAYVPWLQRFLPKPGYWMETTKHLLAIPLYASVLWLTWILSQQIDFRAYLIALILAACLLLFALMNRGKSNILLKRLLSSLSIIMIIFLGWVLFTYQQPSDKQGDTLETLNALLAKNEKVFVDVTAAWCITCKVNEQLVLSTDDIKTFLSDNDVQTVVLDWTDYNEGITQYLEQFNRVGVPLYVYYNEKGDSIILPQILTKDIVKSSVQGHN